MTVFVLVDIGPESMSDLLKQVLREDIVGRKLTLL
jgi:hypothetical protein